MVYKKAYASFVNAILAKMAESTMRQFQDKLRFRKRLYSRVTLVALVAVILLLGNGVAGMILKERQSTKLKENTETKLAELQERKNYLSNAIENLKTPDGIEAEMRENFTIAKPGEKVIIVVKEDNSVATSTSEGFFGGIVEFFKNLF